MKTCCKIFTYAAVLNLLLLSFSAYSEIRITFDNGRGFYDESFDLEVSVEGYGVSIIYTMDGSEPSLTNGQFPTNVTTVSTLQKKFKIPISGSTVVRVYAHNIDGDALSTHTYIFPQDVFSQNKNDAISNQNYPSQWGYGTSRLGFVECKWQDADYEMTTDDDCFSNIPNLQQRLENGLKEIPTMSISLDKDQIFGSDSGIYVYPVEQLDTCDNIPTNVHAWEREASVEIFNNGTFDDLQVNAGLQISGGSTRYFDFYKHSLKLKFRSEYGAGKLNYPVYGDEAVDKFENLQLRMVGHCTPHDWGSSRREQTQYHKDNWVRYLQKELSGKGSSPIGKFFHLFINGLYWGLYDVSERPDSDHMSEYFGGEPEDYEVIKLLEVKSGTDSVYRHMYDLGHTIYDTTYTDPVYNPFTQDTIYKENIEVNDNKASAFYNEITEILDIDKFIDYILLNLYLVNTDWKQNNWWAARNAAKNGKFQFFAWDAEWILCEAGVKNPTLLQAAQQGTHLKYHPIDLNQRLFDVEEYRTKFGDHLQCNCIEEDGVLNPANLVESYKLSEQKIHDAVLLEFARWADVRKSYFNFETICPSAVDETLLKYETEIIPNLLNEMLTIYGKPHTNYNIIPNYYKRKKVNGEYIFTEVINFKAAKFSKIESQVPNGYQLKLYNLNTKYSTNGGQVPLGDIYYTTDGTDPRNIDGTISNSAIKYTSPITINKYVMIKARVFTPETVSYTDSYTYEIDGLWSTMCPREFFPQGYYDGIVINEIHYHPANISDNVSGSNLEFLEIKNTNATEIDLSNAGLTDGVMCKFGMDTKINGNGFLLFAIDSVACKGFYGVTVDGEYEGKLANSGELVTLSRPDGVEIDAVRYDDAPPWNDKPDGNGSSLSLLNDDDDKENNHEANRWEHSAGSTTPRSENVFCVPMTLNFNSFNPSCHNSGDGVIGLNISGGSSPMDISWSTGDNVRSIRNLPADEYTVTVTDSRECVETRKVRLYEPPQIVSNLQVTHALPTVNNSGRATINPLNVPLGYTVTWSGQGNGNTLDNLPPGEYWITIKDDRNPNNCLLHEEFTIEVASSCAMVQNISATPTSGEGAIIAWSGNATNNEYTLSYRVYGDNNWNTVVTDQLTSILLNNLEPCTTYEYKVMASCNNTNSNNSLIKNFTTATASCSTLACNSGSLTANAINETGNSAFIIWDLIPNTTYVLHYKKNSDNFWKEYETKLNFSILFGLDECTDYDWYIDVVCQNGSISSGQTSTFSTKNCAKIANNNVAKNKEKFDYSIYPNPAQNLINIYSKNESESLESQVLIFDFSGRLVMDGGKFTHKTKLNIQDLDAGMYFAQIINQTKNLQYSFKKVN